MPLKDIENTLSSKENKINHSLLKTRQTRSKREIITEDVVEEEQENIVVQKDNFDDLFPEKCDNRRNSPKKRKVEDLIDLFDDEKLMSSQTSSIQLPHTVVDQEINENPHLEGLDLSKNEIIGSKVYKGSSILITKKIKTSRNTKNKKEATSECLELADISNSTEPAIIETNVHVEKNTARKLTRKRKVSPSPPSPVIEDLDQDEILVEKENKAPIKLFEDEDDVPSASRRNLRSNKSN